MFGSFDISTSALTAQRVRLDTIASNMANIHSAVDASGQNNPYRRRDVVFEPFHLPEGQAGVRVSKMVEDPSDFRRSFDPGNPLADAQGYVKYPNVNLSTEYINAIETTRAYEANITAIETTKSMMAATLRVLA